MSPRPRSTKPGAERARFRPDVILNIPAPAGGEEPLLKHLLEQMTQCKRTTVKDYLKHRQVMVNGNVTTQFDQPVHSGDEILVNTSREFQTFYNRRLRIVYEDNDIIVVNKGYGLLSMSTDNKKDGTAYSLLRDYIKRVDPRNKLFIVHRLDQHTSGLMMFAKSIEAKEAMQHNWNNMVLERRYVAVTDGIPQPEEGVIKSYLAENAEHIVYSTDDAKAGQLAITHYCTLRTSGKRALMELSLDTGRKNQIRVHLADKGTPIVGDRKYGNGSSPIHRLALHAQTLRFVHPITKRDMNFSTPVPESFLKLL